MEPTTRETSSPGRPVLLCVSPYVPHAGIDHAGGAFLHLYLGAALAAGWEVRLLAPDTSANRAASRQVQDGVEVLLDTAPDGVLGRLRNLVVDGVPARTGRRWLRRLSPRARDWLRTSDVVDLQWSDSLWNATALRAAYPGILLVGLAHDVRAESLARARRRGRGRARLEGMLGLPAARWRERRELGRLALLSVFKDEDRRLLRSHGVSVETQVMPVLLPQVGLYPVPDPDSRRVLFAAAFQRPENVEAATWFLDEVLDRVRAAVPGLRLRLAGSQPPPVLVARAGPDVEVTGYLPEMARAYDGVACVVVPLLRGAGVKFKTVEAVRAGFPVVTTSVGAEGVVATVGRAPTAVCDDAVSFADEVVRILSAGATTPRDEGASTAPDPDRAVRAHFDRLRAMVADGSDALR